MLIYGGKCNKRICALFAPDVTEDITESVVPPSGQIWNTTRIAALLPTCPNFTCLNI